MKKHLLTSALVLVLSTGLMACSSPQPRIDPVVLDFRGASPITLQVQNLNVVNRAASFPTRTASLPFKPSVSDGVYQWAHDRVRTTGDSGQATLIIKEASATSQPVPVAGGFENWFTRQQAHKYTAQVEVDVEARSADGQKNAFATAHASRSTTLPEDPTDAEKAQAYNDLISGLMHDLDQNLDGAIRSHMGLFLGSGL